jgi:tRNA threonylcarbamoyl adenosine modification protein (Sua5/YciO/YrdC/YwlC family)
MRIVRDMEIAVDLLAGGGLAVFPTETFYGLGCDPWRPASVRALLALKGRPAGRALPLIAADGDQVDLAAPDWRRCLWAARLADAHWPGPLSLVLDASPELAPGVAAEDGSVAIRVTSHPLAAELARRLGRPLVATSANRSGNPPARACQTALEALGGAEEDRVLGLDGGDTAGGEPSTLVDPRVQPPRVLRHGAIEIPAGGWTR